MKALTRMCVEVQSSLGVAALLSSLPLSTPLTL